MTLHHITLHYITLHYITLHYIRNFLSSHVADLVLRTFGLLVEDTVND